MHANFRCLTTPAFPVGSIESPGTDARRSCWYPGDESYENEHAGRLQVVQLLRAPPALPQERGRPPFSDGSPWPVHPRRAAAPTRTAQASPETQGPPINPCHTATPPNPAQPRNIRGARTSHQVRGHWAAVEGCVSGSLRRGLDNARGRFLGARTRAVDADVWRSGPTPCPTRAWSGSSWVVSGSSPSGVGGSASWSPPVTSGHTCPLLLDRLPGFAGMPAPLDVCLLALAH